MKKKRVMALALAAMMATGVLAGCGSSAGGAAGESAASGSETAGGALAVKIWDSAQKDGIQEICDEWSKTSGVKVNVEVVDWDNYWTLLEAGASGGEMPDVFWMHANFTQKYMDNDLLLKLNDYIDKDETIDLNN